MKKTFFPSYYFVFILLFIMASCAKAMPTSAPMLPVLITPNPSTDTPTPQPTETKIPTPAFGIGSTMIGRDGATLVYVPEGKFLMGANYEPSDLYGSPSFSDNQPQHFVTLDSFWIDQTEVTNGQYAECVSAGECAPPANIKSRTHSSYYGNTEFDNYPVIYVDWPRANTYCAWAGRRLPTEAEWEKAARGEDASIYPWGNDAPNDNLLNYNSAVRDTTETGKYPDGKSVYGAYDMAGNVWEWVNDWFGSFYYQNSPTSNPAGPASGETRVLRGGSWYFEDGSLRSIFRFGVIPVDFLVRTDLRSWSVPVYEDISQYGVPPLAFGTVGFRCASSPQ